MLPRDYNANPSIANPDITIAGIQYEKNPGANVSMTSVNITTRL